jgi:hypothetical protein
VEEGPGSRDVEGAQKGPELTPRRVMFDPLITMYVSHPTRLRAEVNRVLFTLAGVGLAWLVMLLVNRLQQAAAKPAA